MTRFKKCCIALCVVALVGCGGWTPKPPPVNPCDQCSPEQTCVDGQCVDPYTEACQALLDEGKPWCHESGMTCGECVHNPTGDPRHCEMAPECPVDPPQECPVCPQGQHCDDPEVGCVPDEVEPPTGCTFPQGIPDERFTKVQNPEVYGSVVNKAMSDLTGCAVGTTCPVSVHVDTWFSLVCDQLNEMGFCCGRHRDNPGGSDQISVKKDDFCDGGIHENYRVINPQHNGVRWYPSAALDAWKVECETTPPPPSDVCPDPPPNTDKMKFQKKEEGRYLDTTWITVNQPAWCASIGYCCMPGTGTPPNTCGSQGCIPRGGCPVWGDGHGDRPACEKKLCDQKWECNGEPYPPYKGNVAQTDCRGHYKTYCANAPTVLEGDR